MTTEARAPRAHVPQAEKSPCSSKDPAQKKERQKEIDFLKKKENHPTLLLKKIRTPFSNVVSYSLNYLNINLHFIILYLIGY